MSVRGLEVLCAIFALLSLLLAYYGTLPVPSMIVLALELYLLIRVRSNIPRRAIFYESYVRMEGSDSTGDFSYDRIETVEKVHVFPILGSSTQVHIRLQNESKPYVITSNPVIRRLNTDLFSWLRERDSHATMPYYPMS